MHRISYNLNKKFKLEKSLLKRIILYIVGCMVNCRVMGEINQLFGLICYILCSRNHTTVYCDKFELIKCIKEECIVSNDVPNEFEDETEILSNCITYREKSPFGRH